MKFFSVIICACLLLFSPEVISQHLEGIPEMLAALEKEQGFNGVVLIAKHDEILFQKGYGFSDKKGRIKTDKNTVYQLASVTKAFTATAIVKLAEENKLRLTDSLGKFFPQAPADKAGITVHQLLTHQSGLPQTYAAEGERNREKAAAHVLKLKMEFRPGSDFIYSNGNYTLLGIIVEKVTGKPWKHYLEQTILKPAGMKQTYFWAEKNKTGMPQAEPLKRTKMHIKDYGYMGSTGIFSSASDLFLFLKFLNGTQLLTPASRELLIGKHVKLSANPDFTTFYSYGLFRMEGRNNRIWLRGNEEAFGTSIACYFTEEAITVIVLANQEKLKNGEKAHNFISAGIIRKLFPE